MPVKSCRIWRMTRAADQPLNVPLPLPHDPLATILPGLGGRAVRELPDADAETLRHLVRQGMGANTLRALSSDLIYLETWCQALTGEPLLWPAPAGLVLQFIAHHLFDPAERAQNPEHGMPRAVAEVLRAAGVLRTKPDEPHAPSTVQRRLSSWTAAHRWRNLVSPVKNPEVSAALKLALKASTRNPERKSARPITLDVLEQLLATCWQSELIDVRDRAMLLTAFCSGGRRRSEVAGLTVPQIAEEPDQPGEREGDGPVPCLALFLGRTKTETAQAGARVVLTGWAAQGLREWLEWAGIGEGPVFRPIGRWGELGEGAMTPEAFNRMIKRRCQRAGLAPHEFSAHGLRSGYLTQACRDGIPLIEAMQMTRHRSYQQAARYYDEVQVSTSRAARLVPRRPQGAGMPASPGKPSGWR